MAFQDYRSLSTKELIKIRNSINNVLDERATKYQEPAENEITPKIVTFYILDGGDLAISDIRIDGIKEINRIYEFIIASCIKIVAVNTSEVKEIMENRYFIVNKVKYDVGYY